MIDQEHIKDVRIDGEVKSAEAGNEDTLGDGDDSLDVEDYNADQDSFQLGEYCHWRRACLDQKWSVSTFEEFPKDEAAQERKQGGV